jgi:elongation factor G
VEHPLPVVTDLQGQPVEALTGDPDGPLLGEVVRTTVDSILGRVCLVRIFSGTLREDSIVDIGGHGLANDMQELRLRVEEESVLADLLEDLCLG